MKVYRVLPDPYSISSDGTIIVNSYPGDHRDIEGIYNKSGAVSLERGINKGLGANSIGENLKEPSKYFFIFPEDAVKCSYILLPYNQFSRIVEYDFPEELVLENVGLGDYEGNVVVETAIRCSAFTGERFKYKSVSVDEQKKLVLRYLQDDYLMHQKYINSTFTYDDELIKKCIKTDYNVNILYFDCNSILTKSEYLSKNMYTIFRLFKQKPIEYIQKMNTEILDDMGLKLDYSNEAVEERLSLFKDLDGVDNTYYIPISSFKQNNVVRQRVHEFYKNHTK